MQAGWWGWKPSHSVILGIAIGCAFVWAIVHVYVHGRPEATKDDKLKAANRRLP